MGASAYRFEGRVAAVTGGSRGIGLATAEALRESGATVIIGALPSPEFDALAGPPYGATGEGFHVHPLDVTSFESCAAFANHVAGSFGGIDAIFCNAGISGFASARETSADLLRRTIDVNLVGVFNCAVAAANLMLASGRGGAIVVTSSNAATTAFQGLSAYGAAKAGVDQLVRSLAAEWGPDSIRVNGVAPGWTEHRMEGNAGKVDEKSLDAAIGRTPLRRIGRVEEIAAAALFLASDAASFITGTVLPVDGGYSAC